MLFQSKVQRLFSNELDKIFTQDNQARKAEAAKRLDFYHDNQLVHLEIVLDKMFSDPSKMTKIFLNIVRKIINNLAQIYRQPPSREIEGSDQDKEIYKQLAGSSMIDIKMKQASRYAKLLKSLLITEKDIINHPA